MTQTREKVAAGLLFGLLLASMFYVMFVKVGNAQSSSGKVVGLWHMDEIAPADYNEITPDATGTQRLSMVSLGRLCVSMGRTAFTCLSVSW
jgi:hypothetical protein